MYIYTQNNKHTHTHTHTHTNTHTFTCMYIYIYTYRYLSDLLETEDMSDKKGQAKDTRVHATRYILNSTKNSAIDALAFYSLLSELSW